MDTAPFTERKPLNMLRERGELSAMFIFKQLWPLKLSITASSNPLAFSSSPSFLCPVFFRSCLLFTYQLFSCPFFYVPEILVLPSLPSLSVIFAHKKISIPEHSDPI